MKNWIITHLTKLRYMTGIVSIALMVISISFICIRGLNWGLDFTGGVVSEIQMNSQITSSEIEPLMDAGFKQDVVAIAADEPGRWILRYAVPPKGVTYPDIIQVLEPLHAQVQVLNTSIVGPQVGAEMASQGGLALLVTMLCILGYLSYRFEWRLAAGALLALMHDVILAVGFFAMTQMEFNLTVLAAILAILGYSLNDSIVIADRIRELLIAKPKQDIEATNNEAIIATFSRTMVTSGTTLMTISSLWLLGGSSLHGFSIAMFIGVLTGTWSSISVGTLLPEFLGLKPEHYLPKPESQDP